MSDKYEDIDFTDEYLRELLASEGLLPLERALIEEVISLRDDVKSKSESGHAVSDAWREAHDEAQREIEAMREKYSTWHPSVVHDCCVMVQNVRMVLRHETAYSTITKWKIEDALKVDLHDEG